MSKEPGPQQKITDAEIEQALIQANGQPTKAAEILDVDYVTIWRRCRENPDLEAVKQAYRGRTFHSLSTLSAAAVIAGVIRQPVTDDEGTVQRDDYGNIIYREVPVSTGLRMDYGNRLMNMYKGSEGIKEQLEVTQEGRIDLSNASKETLKELERLHRENNKSE